MKKKISLLLIMTVCICLTGCFKTKTKEYQNYVKSAMDASYHGEFDDYVSNSVSTEEEAKKLYDSMISYFTNKIIEYTEVNEEYMSDELKAKYDEASKKILNKTKYKVNLAKKVSGVYQVKVEIDPINFWSIIEDDIKNSIEEFNNSTSDELSDEEWQTAEEEYAKKIYEIVNNNIDKVGYQDKVSKIVEIETSNKQYSIANEDWNDIDDYVMGLK